MTVPLDLREMLSGFHRGAKSAPIFNARQWLMVMFLLLAFSATSQSQSGQPTLGPAFKNPEDVWFDGTGNVELTASKHKVEWQGNLVDTNVYSARYKTRAYAASYTPPTIRVNPKTTLNLRLTSRIDYTGASPCDHEYTNLHYHGYEVSPLAPQDDIFIRVENNNNNPYQYRVVLPAGHPEGMFWYHPHPHGCSYWQVNGGLSGILIVGDILKHQYPQLVGIKERILLLKDGDPTPPGALEEQNRVLKFAASPQTGQPDPISVNGMSQPNITINTREKQFFRVGNVGTDSFVKIAFDPPVNAEIIAVDGMATNQGIRLKPEGWLIPPGSRVEMIVEGPSPGVYKLISREIPNAISPPEGTVLATLEAKVGPAPKAARQSIDALDQGPKVHSAYYPRLEEFAEASSPDACVIHSKPPVGDKYKGCDFVFSQNDDGEFLINNKTYKEDVTDVTCKIGKEIEWTLCNDSSQHHAFHIHQIHFDVLSINGQPVEAPVRDVVDMPEQPDPNSVSHTVIKMNFKYDYLAGKFVLHCHMLFHEDKGMMMNVEMEK